MDESTYISIDIESDGPCPGVNSMLSLGAVAFDANGTELKSFSVNLRPLLLCKPHPETMEWWAKFPEAYAATQVDARSAYAAMDDFRTWLATLRAPLVAVCYPAGFDFTFVYWYCHRFLGECPLGFQALDLKTYASAVLNLPFKMTTKAAMPKAWFKDKLKHDHVAVHDAREQAFTFFSMRAAAKNLHELG